jgi:hypothetical protein
MNEPTYEQLEAACDRMKKLLLEYRDTPNCGDYGVTAGWRDAVDHATSSEFGKPILERIKRLQEACHPFDLQMGPRSDDELFEVRVGDIRKLVKALNETGDKKERTE